MNLLHPPSWKVALALLAWLLVLAILPWWLGLSLLLALVAMLLLLRARLLGEHAGTLRWGLRWGLPGMLLSLQRALGGDVLAWTMALLGALAGYMLVVGLELWLDRDTIREPRTAPTARDAELPEAQAEWPARVMSSALGPPAELIELQLPQWHEAPGDLSDPWGGRARFSDGGYLFDGDRRIDNVEGRACFSPDGRWFAAPVVRARGILLWDRRHDRERRLRGWSLAGWYGEQPWLQRHAEAPPCTLQQVLGAEDTADVTV
ncbi:MAG: hypothetical protein ABI379_07350 [Rhodanobacter sp.]